MPWYDCFLIFDRSSWIRRAGGMLFSAIFAEVVFFFINVVLHFMGCIHLLATITHYLKFTIIGYISSKDFLERVILLLTVDIACQLVIKLQWKNRAG